MRQRTLNLLKIGALAAFSITAFNACNTTPPKSMMDIQPGETFLLKEPITIAAETARTFIQHGKITGRGFDRYEQHCRIEVKTLKETAVTIVPDSFQIIRTQIGEEAIAQITQQHKYLALGMPFIHSAHAMVDDDNNRPPTMDYVHLYLKSAKQPDVIRLTCSGSLSNGNLLDAPRSYRPQREQINHILGNIGTIKP